MNLEEKNFKTKMKSIKSKIQSLIQNGMIDDAKKSIEEYERVIHDDVDIYSMKAVLAIMENKLDEAKIILKKGLELDVNNVDLLYNLGYVYEQNNWFNESIKYYKLAQQNSNDQDFINEISHIILKIKTKYKDLIINNRKKIVFFVKQGMDGFLNDIIEGLCNEYETRKIVVTEYNQIDKGMKWADICWFEWCDELIVYGSKLEMANYKIILCRLHSYEAFTNYVHNVNWINVNKAIFVAEHIRDYVLDQVKYLDISKTIIISNGINLNRYAFKERKPGFNIAYVGYINHKKGPMLLLHVFKAIYDKDNRYKLYIAGKFQEPRYLLYFKQMIKEMGLQNNIIYEGWQENINNWLEDKNYVISTSLLESQHLSIMEGMAKGIKPVVHNFVGARHIYEKTYLWNTIDNFVDMILYEPYSSSEYREFIEKKYSFEKQVLDIMKLLDESNTILADNDKSFKYKKYWNERLDARFDIEGVGYIGLGKLYNEYMYKNRLDILEYLAKNIFISIEEKEVLELGPGIGIFTKFFYERKPKSYNAIDISNKSVNELSKIFKQFEFTNGNICDLKNYKNKKYDLIFAADVMLHLTDEDDYKRTIKNIYNSLKDDGCIILFDPISQIGSKSTSPHVRIRDLQYIKNILKENKLKLITMLPSAFFMNYPFDMNILKEDKEIVDIIFKYIQMVFGNNEICDTIKYNVANWLLFLEREFLTKYGFGLSQKVLVITKQDTTLNYEQLSIKKVWNHNSISEKAQLYHDDLLENNYYNINIVKELDESLKQLTEKIELI